MGPESKATCYVGSLGILLIAPIKISSPTALTHIVNLKTVVIQHRTDSDILPHFHRSGGGQLVSTMANSETCFLTAPGCLMTGPRLTAKSSCTRQDGRALLIARQTTPSVTRFFHWRLTSKLSSLRASYYVYIKPRKARK